MCYSGKKPKLLKFTHRLKSVKRFTSQKFLRISVSNAWKEITEDLSQYHSIINSYEIIKTWLASLPSVNFLCGLWPAGVLDPSGVLSVSDFGVNTDKVLEVGVFSSTAGVVSGWRLVVCFGVWCLSGVPAVRKSYSQYLPQCNAHFDNHQRQLDDAGETWDRKSVV